MKSNRKAIKDSDNRNYELNKKTYVLYDNAVS